MHFPEMPSFGSPVPGMLSCVPLSLLFSSCCGSCGQLPGAVLGSNASQWGCQQWSQQQGGQQSALRWGQQQGGQQPAQRWGQQQGGQQSAQRWGQLQGGQQSALRWDQLIEVSGGWTSGRLRGEGV